MTKEESVITKIMKAFAKEKILLQHYVLGKKTDLYFPRDELAIKVDEKGHKDRNGDEEERTKNNKK